MIDLITLIIFICYFISVISACFIIIPRRSPASANAWLLLSVVLPFFGIALYFLIGRKYFSRRRKLVSKDFQNHLFKYHNKTIYSSFLENENIAVEYNYRQNILNIAKAIYNAKYFVNIETYIFSFDKETGPIFEALKNVIKRGVKVRVLSDAWATCGIKGYRKTKQYLKSIGAEFILSLPIKISNFSRPDIRNHRKLIIVDGKTAFSGSFNIIEKSYRRKKSYKLNRRWQDISICFGDEVAKSLNIIFAYDWFLETEECIICDIQNNFAFKAQNMLNNPHDDLLYIKSYNMQITDFSGINFEADKICKTKSVEIMPSGQNELYNLKSKKLKAIYNSSEHYFKFLELLYSAKKHIIIVCPYFVPTGAILNALLSACKRGVKVDLYLSEAGDHKIVHYSQESYYSDLLNMGVNIYLYKKYDILHMKYVLIDGFISFIGSSNLDIRSFYLNLEITFFIKSIELNKLLTKLTSIIQSNSASLLEQDWKNRKAIDIFAQNICRLTSSFN